METPEICINNHDIILWVGDLNYRLDPVRLANKSQTDENELKVKLQEVGMKEADRLKFIRHLLDTSDQLNICKKENRVFGGYKEAEIQFVPSYKFDHNTNRYDSSEKARVPAWTDRILWRDTAGQVKCQYYGVHMDHMISDHKPVSAQFYVDINTKIKSKYQKVYQEEIQKLDKLENEERPSCNLGVHELDFGTMFFRESKSLSIEIKNTGRVPIMFSISLPSMLGGMSSPDSSSPRSFRQVNLPDWLKIDLDRADAKIIMPDQSKTVNFTIFVNEYSVRKLNIAQWSRMVLFRQNEQDIFGQKMPKLAFFSGFWVSGPMHWESKVPWVQKRLGGQKCIKPIKKVSIRAFFDQKSPFLTVSF